MKSDQDADAELELDPTDRRILECLQENCKRPLASIGEEVDLTASSVMERIHKLEAAGVIRGYAALLDARKLGKDVSAFIGVAISHPRAALAFEREVERTPDVLECHHVTGEWTLMLKVKTQNTRTLEQLIDRIREHEGVLRTETMVVLSTHIERARIPLDVETASPPKRHRRGGDARLRRA
jgi:Lrp/AsnC family leucine-responsive transcriptional regulator